MKPYLSLLQPATSLLHAQPEYTAYRLQNTKELAIDGDLSDWPELPILLLDAKVLLGSGRASLDLQRTAPAIAAFQEQPNDVVLLFANASSPHSSRTEDGLSRAQMSQTDRIYEGIFEGMQVGFITGSQIKDGLLDKQKLPSSPTAPTWKRTPASAFSRSPRPEAVSSWSARASNIRRRAWSFRRCRTCPGSRI
ncbi:MAG: hypothetical protein Q7Q73_06790 [Verrucomicrobiota bacterium JB024]|nr:hypothetical protein [Verrucomicrobiota bacterium JB024]